MLRNKEQFEARLSPNSIAKCLLLLGVPIALRSQRGKARRVQRSNALIGTSRPECGCGIDNKDNDEMSRSFVLVSSRILNRESELNEIINRSKRSSTLAAFS